ncbi:MAG TPA: tryptophan 2,3-dioxygenase [Anaerolineales bacterium]|nr:tryptophan 2,3-dioxygenase [Anaerolineales bacterium]HLF02800.1 tryptophan 2,3-dioxygenase [Anaerolineales bacterium]
MSHEQHYGAKLDFSTAMSYGDYLHLDEILAAQHPLSSNHNEMLFIVIHHVSELWMKLALHELSAARAHVKQDNLPPAFKMTARASRVFEQLIQAWDVLSTMTPSEYTLFRPFLGNASGFQSYQYRMIEFVMGNKNAVMLKPHEHRPELHELLLNELRSPSLYDEALRLMAKRGLLIAPEVVERDWTQPYAAHESVERAWLEVYRDPDHHWDLYELAEELLDLEDGFRQWRFRHVTTVERVIGYKTGTGGTPGVPYLRKMIDVVLFPELWKVRTEL